MSELKKPERPPADETYLKLKASVRRSGVQIPLLVREDGTIVDGKRRYWILEELEAEGVQVKFVPCVVLEDEDDPNLLRAEVNAYRRGPSISELLVLAGKEAKEKEGNVKYREVDELVAELLRARGIGPRIFRALVLQTQVVLPADFEIEDEGDLEDVDLDEGLNQY